MTVKPVFNFNYLMGGMLTDFKTIVTVNTVNFTKVGTIVMDIIAIIKAINCRVIDMG